MAGYANRRVYLGFEELTEEGDEPVHLIVKNPKVVPIGELQPADLKTGPDGQVDEESARGAMFKVISGLVLAGRVYDATCFDEDQQPMGLPLSPDDVSHLPWEIVKQVSELVQGVLNPS
jgi:hypothetical protein